VRETRFLPLPPHPTHEETDVRTLSRRLAAASITGLLTLGAVACDATTDDLDDLGDNVEEGVDDLGDDLEDGMDDLGDEG
jgi:uncharacterized protein YaaN involved in tellurite resistance